MFLEFWEPPPPAFPLGLTSEGDVFAQSSGEIGTGSLGPDNRLMSVVRGGGTTGEAQTTVNFQYDANGNLTADGTYAYTYDPLNRLVAV